jgi:hypothetical protein
VFAFIACLIATIVIVVVCALGLCLMILLRRSPQSAWYSAQPGRADSAERFRGTIEWCFEKIGDVWRAVMGNVFD